MVSRRELIKYASDSLPLAFDDYLCKEVGSVIIGIWIVLSSVVQQREGSFLPFPIRFSTVARSVLQIVGELLDGPEMVTEGLIKTQFVLIVCGYQRPKSAGCRREHSALHPTDLQGIVKRDVGSTLGSQVQVLSTARDQRTTRQAMDELGNSCFGYTDVGEASKHVVC